MISLYLRRGTHDWGVLQRGWVVLSPSPCRLGRKTPARELSLRHNPPDSMNAQLAESRARIGSNALRRQHETWWSEFYARSYFHVHTSSPVSHGVDTHRPSAPPAKLMNYTRFDGYAGVQASLIRNKRWPAHGESPANCSAKFTSTPAEPLGPAAEECVAKAAAECEATRGCVAFALSPHWHGGYFPQLYTVGMPGDRVGDDWVLFVSPEAPIPPSPPSPSTGFLISRQNILMRYMDVCSSGRIGGGANGDDYFALKCVC